jgi:hypothetical protein
MLFGSDILMSSGWDSQFPDNVCLLKFSSNGDELWGRVIQSEAQSRPESIQVDYLGNIFISGFLIGEPTTFADQELLDGELIVSYSDQGEELWAFNIPRYAGTWDQFDIRIGQMNVTDNLVLFDVRFLSDSALVGGEVFYNGGCSPSRKQVLISLDRVSGEMEEFLDLNCQSGGSAHQAIQTEDDEFLYLFMPDNDQTVNGVDLGNSENIAYVFDLDEDFEFGTTSMLFHFDNGQPWESRILKTSEKLFFICKADQEFSLNGNSIPEIMGSTYILEFDLTSQIEEWFAPENEFIVYPNPSHSFVKFDGVPDSEIEFYEIYDGKGKLLITDLLNQTQEVDISKLAPGFYTIRIGSKSGRFIKQ